MSAYELYRAANPERHKLLAAAIATLTKDGVEISAEALQAIVPTDFGAIDMKLDHVAEIAAAESGVTATMAAEESGDGAVDDLGDGIVDDPGDEQTPDELRQRVVMLDAAAAELRAQIYVLRNQAATARGALADAIGSFTHGFGPKISQSQNVRNELAASLATRAAQASNPNVAPPPVAGPSSLDRTAMWSGHQSSPGDGRDYLQKLMRVGFRRGAAPASRKNSATRIIPSGRA